LYQYRFHLLAFMKIILTLLFSITALCVQTAYSQDNSSSYRTAIGVKIYPGTITLKQGVNGGNYVEGQAAFFNKGFRLTALYEFHNDINGARGLRWYYGGGPHLGFYNSKHYDGSTLLGVDGILGLDYKLSGTPLNFSLDWQPSFEFGDGSGFDGWGGLAVRIAF